MATRRKKTASQSSKKTKRASTQTGARKKKSTVKKATTTKKARSNKTARKKKAAGNVTVKKTTRKKPATTRKKTATKKASSRGKKSSATSKAKSTPVAKRPAEKKARGKTEQVLGKHSQSIVTVLSGNDKSAILDEALIRSRFWFLLDEAHILSGKDLDAFKVLIKPDFNATELTGSLATDPQLVEHLIDALYERGYTQVIVGESANSFDLCLENRDVLMLADLLGYQYVTSDGHDYEIIDLADELADGGFGHDSVLHGSQVSQQWLEADFVIVFAKNKTDDLNGYSLALDNLLSALPLVDKDYHYKYRLDVAEVLTELAGSLQTDFSIIDAFISNHGNLGARVARPNHTNTLIAGRELLLTDHVAALKMGLDPLVSRNHRIATQRYGLPAHYEIDGIMSAYQGWINVDSSMLEATRYRKQWPGLNQILTPWMQTVDSEVFPFKDPINEQINRIVSQFCARLDDNPNVYWALIAFSHALGIVYRGIEAYQTMYAKDSLYYKEVALNIRPEDFDSSDFEQIPAYLDPLEAKTEQLKADANGLKWTYHTDGSVLFEFSHDIPVDYDDFVSRVEIRKSIQYMNDYIGGLIVPVETDSQGRVTKQLERNLYLPQPNYLVFYQGQNIDVSKLEQVRYGQNEQKMFWQTVKSENGSAGYDDGTVRFIRRPNNETRISIFGRQQFTLPLFWQIVNLDNFPALKDILFTHAYTTFFTTTMANFEAVYEGRDVRIGKPWHEAHENMEGINTPSDKITALLTDVQEFIQRNMPEKGDFLTRLITNNKPEPDYVDEDGFAHFNGASQSKEPAENDEVQQIINTGKTLASGFWKDLYQAVQKDSGVSRG